MGWGGFLSPWSLVSAVLAQSISSTESCCPGLGPLEADSEKHCDCQLFGSNPRKHSGGSGEVRGEEGKSIAGASPSRLSCGSQEPSSEDL